MKAPYWVIKFGRMYWLDEVGWVRYRDLATRYQTHKDALAETYKLLARTVKVVATKAKASQ